MKEYVCISINFLLCKILVLYYLDLIGSVVLCFVLCVLVVVFVDNCVGVRSNIVFDISLVMFVILCLLGSIVVGGRVSSWRMRGGCS